MNRNIIPLFLLFLKMLIVVVKIIAKYINIYCDGKTYNFLKCYSMWYIFITPGFIGLTNIRKFLLYNIHTPVSVIRGTFPRFLFRIPKNKFPIFYGARKSLPHSLQPIHHLSLSYVISIQSVPPILLLVINLNITLPSTPRSSQLSLSLVSPLKRFMHLSCLPYVPYALPIPLFIDLITRIIFGDKYQSKLLAIKCSPLPVGGPR